MKILTASQIREADEHTLINEPIKSIDLMERASKACVDWIINKFDNKYNFKIFCGLGNNGGDGLVIARLLKAENYNIEVFKINYSDKCTRDFLSNEKRLRKIKEIKFVDVYKNDDLKKIDINPNSIIIDAIFGSGLSKPIDGFVADVVYFVNKSNSIKISIDIPSGLFCEDNSNNNFENILKANITLTFEFPKLSFMFPENSQYIGEFEILPIGLNSEFIANSETMKHFIIKEDVKSILKARNKFSHKGNFGHAFLVAGSIGRIGAAVLASKACLKTGAGLLTTHVPKCGCQILQTILPEAMIDIDENEEIISSFIDISKYSAVGIGPGIGTQKETQNALKLMIQNSCWQMIFDADAINIISENKTWLSFLPKNSIFTPHPKEFERLCGKSINEIDRLEKQLEFSRKYSAFVVLKGAHTSISCPDGNIYFNSTGNPGMATAGSGDVLTGIILSLLVQGYSSKHACILGVYIHGLAGDLAADVIGQESLISTNIIEYLGYAFKNIRNLF